MKKLGRVKKEDLFTLEPGEKEYDLPPQMVEEFKKISPSDGVEAMNLIHELSGRFGDRTYQMVKKVAEKTGINFPHLFQSYVEFLLILKMGVEKYRVKETTLRRVVVEIPSCTLSGKWCKECERAMKRAGEISGVEVSLEKETKDGICLLRFSCLT